METVEPKWRGGGRWFLDCVVRYTATFAAVWLVGLSAVELVRTGSVQLVSTGSSVGLIELVEALYVMMGVPSLLGVLVVGKFRRSDSFRYVAALLLAILPLWVVVAAGDTTMFVLTEVGQIAFAFWLMPRA